MADYIFPENPEYITAIRQLESTDPANAALFNDLFEKLIGNTHAVKLETDNKSDLGHTHLPGDCGLGKNLTFTGAVTGTYNGQTDETFLIPDRKGCWFIVGTSTNGWTEKDCDYLCDGTDDQVEIQAAIDALPSTGGKIVLLEGIYHVTNTVTLNKENVILSGNLAILNRNFDDGVILAVSKSNCCVNGFEIQGNKNSFTSNRNHGITIDVNNGENVTIDHIISRNHNGCGIQISSSTIKNVMICNSIFNDNGYCGIYSVSAQFVFIKNNTCGNNGSTGISSSAQNSMIANNKCNNNEAYHGINVSSCKYCIIINNFCSGNPKAGIGGQSCKNSIVSGNVCQEGEVGINFHHSIEYLNIVNNEILNSSKQGIYVSGGPNTLDRNVSILNNMCVDFGVSGIEVAWGNNFNICNNFIYRETYSTERSLYIGVGNSLITNNYIYGKNYVIGGGDTSNNTILNNKCN